MSSYIELKNISQSFEIHGSTISLFEELDLMLHQGTSYAITGPSGTGKSSLLMIASGLEQAASGQINYIKNDDVQPIAALRADIGFIFQQFHLLPELTALNNVALPLKLRGDKQALSKAETWLKKVGLFERRNHKPHELSGGEQQRVAIARALVFEPKFIFADEPTGNLDQKSAQEVRNILINCCKENNAGLIMVTHSENLANRAENIFALSVGKLNAVTQDEIPASESQPVSRVASC